MIRLLLLYTFACVLALGGAAGLRSAPAFEVTTFGARGDGVSRDTEQFLDLGNKPAAFIAGYVNGLVLDGVRVFWPGEKPRQPRHRVHGLELTDADLRGAEGGGTDATPAVLSENSRHVRQ